MLRTGDCICWDTAGLLKVEGVLEAGPIGPRDIFQEGANGGGMPWGDGDVGIFCVWNVVEVADGLCTCGL